jgi:hypothetical protein
MLEDGALTQFQSVFAGFLSGEADPADPALARAVLVHRNTAAKAAQDALAANYPVVRALFGEEAFWACAVAYVATWPPRDARLNAYGEGFAAFLGAYPPARETPYASDVAALERLATEALFAADATALDGAALGAGLHPETGLNLHPATRFAVFPTPAVSIWLAHHEGDDARLEALDWRSEVALVTRPRGRVEVTSLPAGGFAFLEACANGTALAVAAAKAAEAGAELAPLFQTLITAGAFAAGQDGDQL